MRRLDGESVVESTTSEDTSTETQALGRLFRASMALTSRPLAQEARDALADRLGELMAARWLKNHTKP